MIMKEVQELINRVVKAFEDEGYGVYWVNHIHDVDNKTEDNGKTFSVYETCRMNHRWDEMENVTATIAVINWGKSSGKIVAKIKVPKDASDKVIKSRVLKAIEVYENA